MTPEAFCYWLQGCLEGAQLKQLDEAQLGRVREHLATVFTNVTTKKPEPPKRIAHGLGASTLIC